MSPLPSLEPGAAHTVLLRWSAAVAAAALLVYAQTLGHGWVFDDQMEVVLNPFVQSWEHLPRIFSSTVWAGSGMETYLYRPLGQLTFLVNHGISGLEPWSWHLVNVLLHAGISVLVLRLGVRWGLPVAAAGVGALLFAVHPVHVEVVAAVHGRKDLLATAFVLGVALAHPRAREESGPWVLAAVLLLAGAVLSKETGVMAVAVVAAGDLLSRRRREILRAPGTRALYAAYGATLLLYLLVRIRVTGGLGVPETAFWDNPLVGAAPGIRLATALAVVGQGVGTLLVPAVLSPDYSYAAIPLAQGLLDPRVLGAVALMAGAVWAAWRLRERAPWVGVAVAWYGLTLLPGSNLLVLVGTIFGDRLLYLPSVAFCIAVGAGLHTLLAGRGRQRGRAVALAGIVLLVAGLSLRTVQYGAAWSDDVALFSWAVEAVPNSTKAHHKLGEELLRAGRAAEALPYLDRALEIAPDNIYAAATREQALRRLPGR